MLASECDGSDLCLCTSWVRVHACVGMTGHCSYTQRGGGGVFAKRDQCIIMHHQYTKLMTWGYVGQARMM